MWSSRDLTRKYRPKGLACNQTRPWHEPAQSWHIVLGILGEQHAGSDKAKWAARRELLQLHGVH